MDNKDKLELARDWYNDQSTTKKEKVLLENLFPELKESEDERIRKELIRLLNVMTDGIVENYTTTPLRDFVTWLEKQGEKSTIIDVNKMVMEYSQTKDGDFGLPVNCMIRAYKQGINDALKLLFNLEKQGEQKPFDVEEVDFFDDFRKTDSEDKPKFKVGDWVVFNNDHDSIYQIEKIENYEYTLRHILGGLMPLSFSHKDMIRAWTIQDAKDGDVLVCTDDGYKSYILFGEKNLHCWYNGQTEHFHPKTSCKIRKDATIYLATKEQRDLLFQKMKEAGYEWDADKKELRKIEQKTAWSDEDEDTLTRIMFSFEEEMFPSKQECKKNIDFLKSLKNRVQPQPKQEWSKEDEEMKIAIIDNIFLLKKIFLKEETQTDYNRMIEWLKSLKPQPHWKPSKEQLSALNMAYKDSLTNGENLPTQTETLKSLYNELKKL